MNEALLLRDKELDGIDPDHRTLRREFNGETCWVKFAAMHPRRFSSTVFNMMARVSNAPIFRSTHNPNAVEALRGEAKRLREFENSGFLAPTVLAQREKFLVLSDVGKCLSEAALEADRVTRRDLFTRATEHLADVHTAGRYHGRAVAKDMTIDKDGRIGFIDLEHDPIKVMSRPEAQARDFWLLALSASPYYLSDPTLVMEMTDRYAARAPQASVQALAVNIHRLNNVTKFLQPLTSAVDNGGRIDEALRMNAKLDLHMNG